MTATDVREKIETALSASYRIVRELTAGGMSRVFMAEDRTLGRMVVIKVLTPDRVEGVSAERFTREIHLVARLQHPHIVPLFAAGSVQGLPYYTMPYIDGESLRARIEREGTLRPHDAVAVLRDVALALEYAHRRGVVHRDIKPDNVLISGSSACVADFGIARAISVSRTDSIAVAMQNSTLTGSGMTVGTPAYMSPEQATSSPDVDHRTDIYSLGCVAFELLTGQTPFTARSPQAMIAAQVVQQPPIARLRHPSIPPVLAHLVFACLQKSPSDRPRDASEILGMLDAVSSGGSHRAAAAADNAPSVAVLPFENMSEDRDNEFFADGISEEIINSLTHIDGLRVAGRTSSFVFKGSKTDLATIGEKLNVDTILEGSVRKSGNRIRITAQLIKAGDGYHMWSERFDRELTDVFAVQDEIAEAIAHKLKLTLKRDDAAKTLTNNVQAYEYFVHGRQLYYLPGRQMIEAISCFKKALALDDNFGLAHAGLADAMSLSGYYGMVPASDVMEPAHHAAMRALELAPDNSDARHSMALWTTLYGGDKTRALGQWDKVRAGASLRTHVQCSYAIFGLAMLRHEFEKAVDEVNSSIVSDPLNGFAHGILALLKTIAGHDDAVPFARRAVELDPGSFWTQFMLQRALHCAGLHSDAQAQGQFVLEISGRHPWAMAELAVDFATVGNIEGAAAIYDELIARGRMGRIQLSPLALTAVAARRLDDAIALCRRAVAEHDIHIVWSALSVWDGWQPIYQHREWDAVREEIQSLLPVTTA